MRYYLTLTVIPWDRSYVYFMEQEAKVKKARKVSRPRQWSDGGGLERGIQEHMNPFTPWQVTIKATPELSSLSFLWSGVLWTRNVHPLQNDLHAAPRMFWRMLYAYYIELLTWAFSNSLTNFKWPKYVILSDSQFKCYVHSVNWMKTWLIWISKNIFWWKRS